MVRSAKINFSCPLNGDNYCNFSNGISTVTIEQNPPPNQVPTSGHPVHVTFVIKNKAD